MSGLFAGADVGGTKAHVVVAGGEASLERIVPTASWYAGALPGIAAGLAGSLVELSPRTLDALVVGAHGCDTRNQCARLARDLSERLGAPVFVFNDAELVLPAAGLSSGVGLIIGTGSIAVGYDRDGSMVTVGGWGGYLGDEGSGTGLFRDAARAVTRAVDRGLTGDPLEQVLVDLLDLEDLRDLPARLSTQLNPTAWSALAPPLLERALAAGSPLAASVVERSGESLAELIVIARSRGADTRVVVPTGGVVNNAPWLRSALEGALARSCPETHVQYLPVAPVRGALRLAEQAAAVQRAEPLDGPLHPLIRGALR
ncbi:MAG: ATPase [Actinomycetota bacterium]|nr:ATPase [Actinomycetota bacterium]